MPQTAQPIDQPPPEGLHPVAGRAPLPSPFRGLLQNLMRFCLTHSTLSDWTNLQGCEQVFQRSDGQTILSFPAGCHHIGGQQGQSVALADDVGKVALAEVSPFAPALDPIGQPIADGVQHRARIKAATTRRTIIV